MTHNRIETIWEKPEGEHILLNSKSDLVEFLNKTGLVDDCESCQDKFYIKIKSRQMTKEELFDAGIEYDPDYPEDTELFVADTYKPKYIAPIFGNNQFMEKEECTLSRYPKLSHSICSLKEEDVEIDTEIYKFPCVVFANFSKDFDRSGSVEVACWYVTPLESMNTVSSLNKELDENYNLWNNNRIETEKFYKEREEYRKAKEGK